MPLHILIQSFARAFENTSRLEEMHRQTKPKTDFLLFVFALEFVSSSDAMIFLIIFFFFFFFDDEYKERVVVLVARVMPQVVVVVVVLLLLSFSEKLFYSTESFAFLVMCVFQLKQAFVVCDASERKIQNLKEEKFQKKETKKKKCKT